MHPEIRQNTPGMCPECGMNLIKMQNTKIKKQNDKKSHADHEMDKSRFRLRNRGSSIHDSAKSGAGHAGHSTKMFLRRFWISFILTIPVVLYAPIVQTFFKWSPPSFPGDKYLSLILGSIVFFYGGFVFLILQSLALALGTLEKLKALRK